MSYTNEKVYRAITQTGGEEQNLTLEDARKQVEVWTGKGYYSWVEHMHDPYWEDVEIVAPITPLQVAESLGHDRVALKDFVAKLMDMLDYDVSERVGGFMVYTYEGD